MREQLDLQKDLLHRVLRLHALRSRDENFELLQLASDDKLIFDLAYHQIMERVAADENIETERSSDGQIFASKTGQILYWLSSHRSQMLTEINSIVDALGGIEIATYLIDDQPSETYQFD